MNTSQREALNDFVAELRDECGIDLRFDWAGVEWLERLFTTRPPEEFTDAMIIAFGYFLGECIIHTFGGEWFKRDGVELIQVNMHLAVSPLNWVAKRRKFGVEDNLVAKLHVVQRLLNADPDLDDRACVS